MWNYFTILFKVFEQRFLLFFFSIPFNILLEYFFEWLYSQKIKTSKLKTEKIKSLMEEEIPSGREE